MMQLRFALLAALVAIGVFCRPLGAQTSLAAAQRLVEPKLVKIYGAGGSRGLESYQSGFLISADGEILTAFSYVLDGDATTVLLSDGRKLTAEVRGIDPRLEIALLKVDAQDLPHFNLQEAVKLEVGSRVLAFGNVYGIATGDEPLSVLRGIVSAKTTMAARSGAYATPYRGSIYVLDALTNNPGAPGGVVTNRSGALAAMLGKELRSSQTGALLHYGVPVEELTGAVEDLRAGKTRPLARDERAKRPKDAHSLEMLGVRLVLDLLPRTPPYVDGVKRGSVAERAGLKADDLVLMVNGRMASSCKAVREEVGYIDQVDEVRLLVQRGKELLEIVLMP